MQKFYDLLHFFSSLGARAIKLCLIFYSCVSKLRNKEMQNKRLMFHVQLVLLKKHQLVVWKIKRSPILVGGQCLWGGGGVEGEGVLGDQIEPFRHPSFVPSLFLARPPKYRT